MEHKDNRLPRLLDWTVLYESRWVNLYSDKVALPNGHILEQYHVLDFGRGAVAVVVENEQGQILADQAFDYQLEWWQLAFDSQGQPVGFILPVLFRGAEKNGSEEGTFYYVGDSPGHRGNHYRYDPLCRGTAFLQEIGVWRICSDTDILNAPMIKSFQDVGYQQFGSPKKVLL